MPEVYPLTDYYLLACLPLHNIRHGVLDVGCGTGGWLIEVAQTYPSIEVLVDVDISGKMVEYARERAIKAGITSHVEFHLMDALRMLEFPTDFFDLVNMRFGQSFLRTWEWPKLLHEFQRVTKPGGIIRITETSLESKSNSPSLTKLQSLLVQAFHQAGHTPGEGVVAGIPRLLNQQGLQQVQINIREFKYHMDTIEGQMCIEDITRIFRTALPFLQKWVQVPDDYETLYQQMLVDIHRPDFVTQWPILTAWGTVRGGMPGEDQ